MRLEETGANVAMSGQRPVRVVILDDHAIVRLGIETHLGKQDSVTVLGAFSRTRDLVGWLGQHNADVDVIMLDYMLGAGDIDGARLVRLLHGRFPTCSILIVSSCDNPSTVIMAMRAGASGFFVKNQDLRELGGAIRTVASGHIYLAEDIRNRINLPKKTESTAKERTTRDKRDKRGMPLSRCEHEVLRCCLSGMAISEIAAKFSRSPKTISAQKQSAFRKLGIQGDIELFAARKILEEI